MWVDFLRGGSRMMLKAVGTRGYCVSALCPLCAFEVGQFELILSSDSSLGLGLTEQVW